MRGNFFRIILLSSAMMTPVSIAQAQATAPQGDARNDSGIADIIVTATKRAENVQDIPIAITALDATALDNTGTGNVLELTNVTPGLLATESSGSISPYIRGVGTRTVVPGNDSPTAFYVDDVYISDKTSILLSGFNDVETVAVLRGPQGTLFGRNATAGAITVKTLDPGRSPTAKLSATLGTDERTLQAFVASPLGQAVRASLSGFYQKTTDYIHNNNPANGEGDKVGGAESYGVRAKILADLGEDISLRLAGDYIRSDDSSRLAIQPYVGGPLSTAEITAAALGITIPVTRERRNYAGNVPPSTYANAWGVNGQLTWHLGSANLKSTTSYRKNRSSNKLDLDGSPLPILNFDSRWFTKTFQQEINLASDGSHPLTWSIGGYFLDQRTGYDPSNIYIGLPWPFNPANINPAAYAARQQQTISNVATVHIKSAAAFGELGYRFDTGTSVNVGIRYTDERHSLGDDNRIDTITPSGQRVLIISAAQTCALNPTTCKLSSPFSKVTYRAVIKQEVGTESFIYGSYNRGFKSGVYNISTGSTVFPTQPEVLDAFEVGLKSEFFDRTLIVNLAAYKYKYSNMQVAVTDTTSGGTQRVINAASARVSGLEAELQWKPNQALYIGGGASTFFEAKYTSFPKCDVYDRGAAAGVSLINVTVDCTGERLPVTPDFTGYITGTYTADLGNSGALTFGGLLNYVASYDQNVHSRFTTIQAPKQDAYTNLNLFIRWEDAAKRYSLKLWGNNVTGVNISQGQFQTNFGYDAAWNRKATFGATLAVNLGK